MRRPQINTPFLAPAVVLCTLGLLSPPTIARDEVVQSLAGAVLPAEVLGVSIVNYDYKHSFDCAACPAWTTGWCLAPGSGVPLVAGAHVNAVTTLGHHGSSATSAWQFTAALAPGGGIALNDLGFSAGLGPWAVQSIAVAGPPPVGHAWNAADCRTALTIGGVTLGPYRATDLVARRWWGLQNIRGSIRAESYMEKEIDDGGVAGSVWTMDADGYDPFNIFQEQVRFQANGPGGEVYAGVDGLTLSGPYASIDMTMFALNHGGFTGTATLDEGVFATTGGLADLPWQLTYDGGQVASAFLPPESMPGGEVAFFGSDIGDSAFWDASPSFFATYPDGDWDMKIVPEPLSLALLSVGLLLLGPRSRLR